MIASDVPSSTISGSPLTSPLATSAAPWPRPSSRFTPRGMHEFTLDELSGWLVERGEPRFRACQLFEWTYRKLVPDYEGMTTLPKALRERLAAELPMQALTPLREIHSDDGETIKVLYRTADGQALETVLMFYAGRATVCVSCQVGCAVGCSFCATGLMGLTRNLSAGEMVAQIVDMARRAREHERPLTNVVMMGMGEPFHNYDAMLKMIGIVHDPAGMGLGARRITVSTSGVVPFIDKLAGEPYQVNLAISIHAATDALRSSLVPLNRRWPLVDLLAACQRYSARTGRRVSFEYALISTVNDGDDDARELARRLTGMLAHVNLIPLNPTPATPFERPSPERIERFAALLREAGVPATVRYSRGVDIAAACGQLRIEAQGAA